jgi:hypothetical protein
MAMDNKVAKITIVRERIDNTYIVKMSYNIQFDYIIHY